MKKKLFPTVFKTIGLSIILLTFLVLLVLKLLDEAAFNKISADKMLFRQIVGSVFFIGFLLIILAREKIEDEFADFCRLTAFRLSFLFGLISVILNSIPFLKINNNLDSSYHLLFIQCIFYLIIFYATKVGLVRYEK